MSAVDFAMADLLAEFETSNESARHELCITATPTGPRRGMRAANLYRVLNRRLARARALMENA